MFTERLALLPGGIQLSYTDSGAPAEDCTDYTTVIIAHGMGFNARGFEKLHDLAAKHNFRTIAFQRRGYQGSTEYTASELDDQYSGKKVFIDRLALELAYFCQHIVEEHTIPLRSKDGKSGGIALLGWSMGAACKVALQNIYGAWFYMAYGYDLPSDYEAPKPVNGDQKQALTNEEIYGAVRIAISGYYDKPKDWSGDINTLDQRMRADEVTVDRWTAEENTKYFSLESAMKTDFSMFLPPFQKLLGEMTQRVLFMPVTLLYPERTHWYCVWGAWVTQKLYKECVNRDEVVRQLNVVHITGGNHFTHYDKPDEFLTAVQFGLGS
uniref:AB hydrolase-1 domain-containing protein n=1 Tax=Psilocybe cubensis TaxID=181762 RepID=A0A8H7Y398_PSICU